MSQRFWTRLQEIERLLEAALSYGADDDGPPDLGLARDYTEDALDEVRAILTSRVASDDEEA